MARIDFRSGRTATTDPVAAATELVEQLGSFTPKLVSCLLLAATTTPARRDVCIREDGTAFVVQVTNAVVRPEEIARLAARLDWLRDQPDPAAAWLNALSLATTGASASERPGLGIIRIAYEGGRGRLRRLRARHAHGPRVDAEGACQRVVRSRPRAKLQRHAHHPAVDRGRR